MTNNYTSMFNKIILSETRYSEGKKLCDINCKDLTNDEINFHYTKIINKLELPYELIGKQHQQIKPCFDLDPKFTKDSNIDVPKTIEQGLLHIRTMYPNNNNDEDVKLYSRIRDLGEFKKFSYHAIVGNIRTDIYTIKTKLERRD